MGPNNSRAPEMKMTDTPTFHSHADVARVVMEARAARADAIRALAHDFAVAIKRLFTAFRTQAAH
jgi:hypothetical protein